MITHVTLTTLPVRDQDRALDFFVGKLGMKVRTDQPYGPGARWIEVAEPDTQSWGTFILATEPDGRQICITQNDSIMHHA